MKVTQFEGTPEEFKAVAHLFEGGPEPGTGSTPEEQPDLKEAVDPKEALRRVFRRRPIPDGQMTLYRALADGPLEHGEIPKRTGYTMRQISGVLGALGRRVNHTEGIEQAGLKPDSTAVVDWDHTADDKWYLHLTEDAADVLRDLGII